MPCGRFKRVRQAEVVSPEFKAFQRKLKLTILMTLVSEEEHDHQEVAEPEYHSRTHDLTAGGAPIPALSAGDMEVDLLLEQLRSGAVEAPHIPREAD